MSTVAKDRRVPFLSRIAYGLGESAEGMKRTATSLFVLFYYNQVLGLPGTLAGAALFIALVVDSVTDPLIGSLSDHCRSKLGRRHPFMFAAALPVGLSFIGLFSPPSGLGQIGLFLWLSAFAALTRTALTLYNVPHMALGAEITESSAERTRLIVLRQFFSYAGTTFATVVGVGWFFSDARGGRLLADNYPRFALVLGVVMAIAILIAAAGTRSEIRHVNPPPPRQRGVLAQIARDVRDSTRTRPFVWLAAGTAALFLSAGVHLVLSLYLLEYFWALHSGQMVVVRLAMLVGLIAGVLVVRVIIRSTSKRFTLLLGTAGSVSFQVLPVVLRLVEFFPPNGAPGVVRALIATEIIQGVFTAFALVAYYTMMTDVTDAHELETGARREGILFGVITFAVKASAALANIIAGVGLDVIKWPRGAEVTVSDVPAQTITHLGIFYGPVLMVFSAVGLWCYLHYQLDGARRAEIMRELYARRRAAAAGAGKPA